MLSVFHISVGHSMSSLEKYAKDEGFLFMHRSQLKIDYRLNTSHGTIQLLEENLEE